MKIPQLNQWEPVRIAWNDANGGREGWVKLKKADRCIAGCVTVGQVESQSAERITIVLTFDSENKHAHGSMTIPISAITNLERLS